MPNPAQDASDVLKPIADRSRILEWGDDATDLCVVDVFPLVLDVLL